MLLPKPIIEGIKIALHKRKGSSINLEGEKGLKEKFLQAHDGSESYENFDDPNILPEEEHDLSEIFVH